MNSPGERDSTASVTEPLPSLAELSKRWPALTIIQRSLEKGRLAHAYLLCSPRRELLETVARTLGRIVLCERRRGMAQPSAEACGECRGCRLVAENRHPDFFWLRPAGKLRQIHIERIRDLERELYLRASLGGYRVAVISDADRMNPNAANAFLKTLEEPPPQVLILLLSSAPERLLETIRSRCLRLDLERSEPAEWTPEQLEWIQGFVQGVVEEPTNLLRRYQALARLIQQLEAIRADLKQGVQEELRPPGEGEEPMEPEARKEWEAQVTAVVEAEYRRERERFLSILLWWLRDLWIATEGVGPEAFRVPELAEWTQILARNLSPQQARRNLQEWESALRILNTNVQEALILEVALLRLRFHSDEGKHPGP